MSQLIAQGETIEKFDKAKVVEPMKQKGKLYLTRRRLAMFHTQGRISKKETVVFDIPLEQVSSVQLQGVLSQKLVVSVRGQDGRVFPYKLDVPKASSWSEKINSVRRTGYQAPVAPPPQQAPPQYVQWPPPAPAYQPAPAPAYQPPQVGPQQAQPSAASTKYCVNCGREVPTKAAFCPFCGGSQ